MDLVKAAENYCRLYMYICKEVKEHENPSAPSVRRTGSGTT